MALTVQNAGLLTTVQDLGRVGYQSLGVPVSGVMDARSAKLANILVNNAQNEAVLEVTVMGPKLTFSVDCTLAITGGNLSPQKNTQSLEMYKAHIFKAGDVLSFGAQKSGCRAYIAFAGGLDILPIMESCATYLKAQMGGFEGRALQQGDSIAFKHAAHEVPHLERRALQPEDFSAKQKNIRVIMGPQDDLFTSKGLDTFAQNSYTLTAQCDRMGYRLEGAAIEHVEDGNIISDGICMGAIQVPSDGQPIILMADRQTTGGYSKIAHVISVDLPLIAQGKYGDSLRFEAISIEEAQKLYLEEFEVLQKITADAQSGNLPPLTKEQDISHYVITLEGKEYKVSIEALA